LPQHTSSYIKQWDAGSGPVFPKVRSEKEQLACLEPVGCDRTREGSLGNLRLRGKIARAEWPKIAARVAGGESMAAIARSYQCTAPAIRYIVHRSTQLPVPKAPALPHFGGRPTARLLDELRHFALDDTAKPHVDGVIFTFLEAVDAFIAARTVESEEALLSATAQILRSTASLRLELEPVMKDCDRVRQIGNSY
jgi:hypothetical protein